MFIAQDRLSRLFWNGSKFATLLRVNAARLDKSEMALLSHSQPQTKFYKVVVAPCGITTFVACD